MLAELRSALRSLRRAPWYACTVVGVMALALTLATVVFAIVDGVLFRPLPYPEADRPFAVEPGFDGTERPEDAPVSAVDLANWAAASRDVAFSGFSTGQYIGYGTGVNDYVAGVVRVQPNIFDVLGVQPLMGGFADSDFEAQSPLTPAIIGWDLWQGRFLADPDIVGHVVIIDRARGTGFRVVGVMPRGFSFPSERAEVRFLIPHVVSPSVPADPSRRIFSEVIARGPAGITRDSIRARVEAGMLATAAVFPDIGPRPEAWSDADWRRRGPYDSAQVVALASSLGRVSKPLLFGVFVAVLVLVALGTLNASGLMAARTLDRHRELSVRRALGASRMALGRLVAIESLVLLTTAGLIAFFVAAPSLRFVLTLLPDDVVLWKPWRGEAMDVRAAAFVALGALALAVPTSAWPMRRALSLSLARGALGGQARERNTPGRFTIISAQVAAVFVLSVVGSLLVGSLLTVYSNPLPIRTDHVVLIEFAMQGPEAHDTAERARRVGPLLDRVRQVPGVAAVALTNGQVLQGPAFARILDYGFWRPPAAAGLVSVRSQAVTADYYRVVEPQLVAGRLPTEVELAGAAPVVVVSENTARDYWPGDEAIGRVLESARERTPYTVVGVVRDVPWASWDTDVGSVYGPYAPLSWTQTATLFVDVAGRADRVTRDVLAELARMEPSLELRRAAPLADVFTDTVRARRFRAWLFGSFAVAGLVVVGFGILGLLAMSSARRTREVGIRLSLGATRASVVRLLMREQLLPVVSGLAVGAVISAWVVNIVESYLYQVTTTDPRAWVAAAALVLATAAIGALAPAVRASGTDPTRALRAE